MGRRLRDIDILIDQQIFFVSTATRNHEHFFKDNLKLAGLYSIIGHVSARHNAQIYGYVLMPNHFHLLISIDGGPSSANLCMMLNL